MICLVRYWFIIRVSNQLEFFFFFKFNSNNIEKVNVEVKNVTRKGLILWSPRLSAVWYDRGYDCQSNLVPRCPRALQARNLFGKIHF